SRYRGSVAVSAFIRLMVARQGWCAIASSSLGCVLDVDAHLLEAQPRVEPEGRPVGLLDVELDPVEATVAQVSHADQGERLPESAALLRRIDAEDVDLAGVGLDLGPVVPDQPVVSGSQEEAGGVEPRLRHALGQVAFGPAALL